MFFRCYAQPDHEAQLPLVLIHGAGGNLAFWPPQVRRLPGALVYALDLPGHGHSTGPSFDEIDAYAAAVLAFLDAEDLPPVLLAGHSMGGAVALAVAGRAPARIAALGLIATGARLPVSQKLLAGLATDYDATTARLAAWSLGPTVDDKARATYERNLARVEPQTLIDDFTACSAFDARPDLAALTMPTLVLCGAQDRMTPPHLSQELAAHLARASLCLLAETGHMIPLERPQRLAELLGEFHKSLTESERT